jgi:hypothetical protein
MKGTNTLNQRNAFSSENTLHLNVAGHSEVRRLLEHNEDAFALYNVSDPDLAEHLGKLYLLADGTGRHAQVKLPVALLSKRFLMSIIIRARVFHP